MKSYEHIYKKILRDARKYISNSKNNKRLYYIDGAGEETEAIFDTTPFQDEIEGLLIFLNKDKITQA